MGCPNRVLDRGALTLCDWTTTYAVYPASAKAPVHAATLHFCGGEKGGGTGVRVPDGRQERRLRLRHSKSSASSLCFVITHISHLYAIVKKRVCICRQIEIL